MEKYDHKKIESKWQEKWDKDGIYQALDSDKKPKYYSLVEFPYPSGDGLHVGHVRSYTAMDIVSRKRRAEGYNVLYPMGWDAFGLPTENYSIKTKTPPDVVTKNNSDNFRRQLKSLGLSFDWSREINTTDPEYYKWTQWIFIQLFNKGLAYKKKTEINWCVDCKIGLANEEVVGGVCERCGGPTEKREKEQWMLAITKYADRLHKDLDDVNYLEKIKIQQRNWIGRSEGAIINFKLNVPGQEDGKHSVDIFTTRPDTLFGATFLAISAELAKKWIDLGWQAEDGVKEFISLELKKRSKADRKEEKEKNGIFSGVYGVNPVNNEKIPVWIVNYVLGDVGTGAIMAVPAHDERDYEFAKKYNLPINHVVIPRRIDERNPHVDGKEITRRKIIIGIVKDPKTDKYMVLKWKTQPWTTFITGGVEAGEEVVESAKREILEETGYNDLKFIQVLGGPTQAEFFAAHKDVNRITNATTVVFELNSDSQEARSEEESSQYDIGWLTLEELKKVNVQHAESDIIFSRLSSGNFAYTESGVLINSGSFDGMNSEDAKEKIIEKVGGKKEINFKLRDWVFSRQRYWGEPIPLISCPKDGWVPVPEAELPLKLPQIGAYTPTDTGESPLAKVDEWVNVKCPKCGADARRETDTMPQWAGSSWYFLRYLDPKNNDALADKNKINYFMPVDWYNGGMEHTTLHLLYSRFWYKFLFDIGVVPESEPYKKRTSHGMILAKGGEKMSKSKGNVVNPDSIVETYGADTLRVYEMFLGPFDQAVSWNTESIIGSRRFLERVWKLSEKVVEDKKSEKIESAINSTIKKVTNDIEEMRFNTAISEMMILVNEMDKEESISKKYFEDFIRILSPFAPHMSEEIWMTLGNKNSVHTDVWPKYDDSKIIKSELTIVIQVNGKVRGEINIEENQNEDTIKNLALENSKIRALIEGKEVKKVIYVKGKLVSIVI